MLVLYVVWGSTYLGMKVAIDTMPPFVMGVFRFVPAGVILSLLVVAWNRGRIARPTRRQLRDASIVGTMLLVGGTGLVAWGEQTIPTGIAALLIALVPMWLAIFGFALYRRVGAAARRRRHRRRPRRRRDPRLAGRRRRLARSRGPPRADRVARLLGAGDAVRAQARRAARARAPRERRPDVAAGLAFVVVAALTGEWATFDVSAVSAASWAASSTSWSSAASSATPRTRG